MITSSSGISALIYENGRTIQSLLGLGADDEYNSDVTAAILLKYGPHMNQAELLRKAALVIVYEAFTMDWRLPEMVGIVLINLQCH